MSNVNEKTTNEKKLLKKVRMCILNECDGVWNVSFAKRYH